MPPPTVAAPAEKFKPLVLGIDEYQMYFYEVLGDGRTVFFKASDGSFVKQLPPTSLGETTITSASRSLVGEYVALGTIDGRVTLQQVRFVPKYEEQKLVDLDISVRDRGLVELDPEPEARARGRLRGNGRAQDRGGSARGRRGAASIARTTRAPSTGPPSRRRTASGSRGCGIGRSETLIASTDKGNLYHWELDPEVRLTEVAHVSDEPITALDLHPGQRHRRRGRREGQPRRLVPGPAPRRGHGA